jgi:hypothetical protein
MHVVDAPAAAAGHFLHEDLGESGEVITEGRRKRLAGLRRAFDDVFDEAHVDRDRSEGEVPEALDPPQKGEEEDVDAARLEAGGLPVIGVPDGLVGAAQRSESGGKLWTGLFRGHV